MTPLKTAVAVFVAVVVLCTGGWLLYWRLALAGQNNQYNVNTHSQQYQAGLIAQERDRIAGYDAAIDPAQKQQIKTSFCQVYPDLTQPPIDIQSAHARIC